MHDLEPCVINIFTFCVRLEWQLQWLCVCVDSYSGTSPSPNHESKNAASNIVNGICNVNAQRTFIPTLLPHIL